jgi:hypothetical protein
MPRGDGCGRLTHARLSTECYIKGAHPQRNVVVDIHKFASVEDDYLEADVRSASRGMDTTHHEVPG